MKIFQTTLLSIVLSTVIRGSPCGPDPERRLLERRGAILTAPTATEFQINRRFLLENNLWGRSAATNGSQSSQVTSTSGNSVTWYTKYTWIGANNSVKSFANLDLKSGMGKALVNITSIPTAWSWSYTSASSDLKANVAYDLWLSATPGTQGASTATTSFEVMVWLSQRGAARPFGTALGTVTVNGVPWLLYSGLMKTWTLFTFQATSEVTRYNSDLKPFFSTSKNHPSLEIMKEPADYLIANKGVPSSNFFVQAQAGTEPFIGSATLSTSSYSLAV
ncbi:concanavalin A-like lectin/glucanase domain-containing protein, partial [Mycena haematopus]